MPETKSLAGFQWSSLRRHSICMQKKRREPDIVSYKGHKVIDLALEKT